MSTYAPKVCCGVYIFLKYKLPYYLANMSGSIKFQKGKQHTRLRIQSIPLAGADAKQRLMPGVAGYRHINCSISYLYLNSQRGHSNDNSSRHPLLTPVSGFYGACDARGVISGAIAAAACYSRVRVFINNFSNKHRT
ncbi:hypothetical protein FJW01_00770 [Pantoea deleyi]|uniref:Uncharacterized protein n=1 Tax=Pantoea deleyi TaxID=470932 RepID=A0A506QVI0_9GAMM|nr:hypothetical protein FJW01_00770 [Pantoea deleyi]